MINHALRSSVKSSGLNRLIHSFLAIGLLGLFLLSFTSAALAAALPKNWTVGTGISGGELTAPATGVVVAPSASVTASVNAASDSDHWTQGGNSDDTPDTISYTWSCDQGGSFSSPNSASTTWAAPTTAGNYTLVCVINDGGVVPTGETGNRDDTPLVRTVTVTVQPNTLSVVSEKTSICAGAVASAPHQSTITATLKTSTGTPLANQTVSFSVVTYKPYPTELTTDTASLSDATALTNSSGQAIVTLISSRRISATAVVTATSENAEPAETGQVVMGKAIAVGDLSINPQELIADGTSTANVKLTLQYGGVAVDGHNVTWRINKVWDGNNQPVYTADPAWGTYTGYGDVSPGADTTDADGIAETTYTTGTEAGTIEFAALDQSVVENSPALYTNSGKAIKFCVGQIKASNSIPYRAEYDYSSAVHDGITYQAHWSPTGAIIQDRPNGGSDAYVAEKRNGSFVSNLLFAPFPASASPAILNWKCTTKIVKGNTVISPGPTTNTGAGGTGQVTVTVGDNVGIYAIQQDFNLRTGPPTTPIWQNWETHNSGLYQIYDAPKSPESPPAKASLERALGHIDGQANSAAGSAYYLMLSGVDITYDGSLLPYLTNVWENWNRGAGQCTDEANLMCFLLKSIGIEATPTYWFGGTSPAGVALAWEYMGSNFPVSIYLPASGAPNPHTSFAFTYHVTTNVGAAGHHYDSALVEVDGPTVTHMAPGATLQSRVLPYLAYPNYQYNWYLDAVGNRHSWP